MPFRGLMEKSASSFIRDYIKEEDNVLDLGSGPGFFTVKIAKKVGPQGRVYAVDADENSIDILLRRIKELSLSNVTPIIASADDLSFISDE
ncbi:MAG: class I SAM-dependent methyltransferase, partial [Thermocladium sp.]